MTKQDASSRRWTLDFLKTEAASGAILGIAALAALIVANSPMGSVYFDTLKSEQVVQLGGGLYWVHRLAGRA